MVDLSLVDENITVRLRDLGEKRVRLTVDYPRSHEYNERVLAGLADILSPVRQVITPKDQAATARNEASH